MGKDCKKFVAWRRVSTKKQRASGLGLEAQRTIIEHFAKTEGGEIIADFHEVYTGKDLDGCTELRKAMQLAKNEGATLMIAKTDRFRNTVEALRIYEEMGGNIYFCDLPHTDKFTLTLFFALAEREALLVSIRTKQALAAKKAAGFTLGNKRGADLGKAGAASAAARRAAARKKQSNVLIWEICSQYTTGGASPTRADFEKATAILVRMGVRSPSGLALDVSRVRTAYYNLRGIMKQEII